MANFQKFDAEIAKTRDVVEDMRSKIEQSSGVLDKIAKTDAKIGAADFDIEILHKPEEDKFSFRIQDLNDYKQYQLTMDGTRFKE